MADSVRDGIVVNADPDAIMDVIADFEAWVELGAPDPRDGLAETIPDQGIDFEAGRQFWSFQAPKRHDPPRVENEGWIETPIDAFLLARIEAEHASIVGKTINLNRVAHTVIGIVPPLSAVATGSSTGSA